MVWAIREAAAKAGRFDDAQSGQEFFARLSEEISAAATTVGSSVHRPYRRACRGCSGRPRAC